MSGLNNLQKRLEYRGGASQADRMRKDKAWSLDKALLYSYQAETAILSDGREFRCLINPNKLSMELDDKMLSIPFADVCLNGSTKQKVAIDVKPGDTITWKENNTHLLGDNGNILANAYYSLSK